MSVNLMGNSGGNRNYKDIYDLLERLCKTLGPANNQRNIMRHVTQYISNCPTSLGATLPFDEASLVSKITQHLQEHSEPPATPITGNGSTPGTLASQSTACLFINCHEQLKASQLDSRQRSALLTFLYYMADAKFPENGYSTKTYSSTASNFSGHPPIQSIRAQLFQNAKPLVRLGAGSEAMQKIGFSRTATTTAYSNTSEMDLKIFASVGQNSSRTSSDTDISESNRIRTTVATTHIPWREHFPHIIETENNVNNDIVQNAIYTFTGIQGKYLKKDIVSGKFKLGSKAKLLNIVQAGMLLRLSELGYYHDLVQSYADVKSGLCALGLVGQGFVSALRNELTKYYGMVAMLQEQLNQQRGLDKSGSTNCQSTPRYERLTLLKMLVWSVDPLQRLQWLVNIADACKEKKGGALASTVYDFLSHGNPMVQSLTKELLLALCGPLYQMLARWLLEGEINDPHAEFFIECMAEVGQDRLWHDKYRVRTGMLPNFISTELAHKILVTGKSINFLCEICEDKQPVKGRDELRNVIDENPEHIFSCAADTRLHSTIDSIYLNTSKRILDIVKGPHKLLEHLLAMRRYLLLGQGDFIGILMSTLKKELDKPAKELYTFDLSAVMDGVLRSTNAQYDDPEILNHLDVRLMTPCEGDIGWDILSLKYTVRGPLATILEPTMGIYQLLFKPLWRLKHMEFLLSCKVWKEQKCNAKPLRPMADELKKVLYRLHLFTSEMIHFIHQMQYYILFEVIECSWAELQERVQQAKTLDDILNAHDDFLTSIKCGAFLDPSSGELCQNMEIVYESIIRLEMWQDSFYAKCFSELNARKQYEQHIVASEKKGEFGATTEKQLARTLERKKFEQILKSNHKSLENIGADIEKAVHCFLLALNSNNDHNLQLFGIRLDFNEYYKKRDQRLCVPLTFEHMRMSNVFYNTSKTQLSRHSLLN